MDFEKIRSASFSDKLWREYQRYLSAVCTIAPEEYSLRDKDRFLWAKSLIEHAENEIAD